MEENCEAGVLINDISDHLPVYYIWNDDTAVDDSNMSYNNFISNFMGLYNQCFPVVTNKIKSVWVNSKHWFTSGLGKSMQKKN